jgi:hypothetical protein
MLALILISLCFLALALFSSTKKDIFRFGALGFSVYYLNTLSFKAIDFVFQMYGKLNYEGGFVTSKGFTLFTILQAFPDYGYLFLIAVPYLLILLCLYYLYKSDNFTGGHILAFLAVIIPAQVLYGDAYYLAALFTAIGIFLFEKYRTISGVSFALALLTHLIVIVPFGMMILYSIFKKEKEVFWNIWGIIVIFVSLHMLGFSAINWFLLNKDTYLAAQTFSDLFKFNQVVLDVFRFGIIFLGISTLKEHKANFVMFGGWILFGISLIVLVPTVHYMIPLFLASVLLVKYLPLNLGRVVLAYSLALVAADNYRLLTGDCRCLP